MATKSISFTALEEKFKNSLWDFSRLEVGLPAGQKEEMIEILNQRRLTAIFQPVVDFSDGRIFGFEGRIRGPVGGRWHAPEALFQTAAQLGWTDELDDLCRLVLMDRFTALELSGCLLLKFHRCRQPATSTSGTTDLFLEQLFHSQIPVILEVAKLDDGKRRLPIAVPHLEIGGLTPDALLEGGIQNILIDRHFTQNIDQDPTKQRHVEALGRLAHQAGIRLIAQGIETRDELRLAKELGVTHGMGLFIGRPRPDPITLVPMVVKELLEAGQSFTDRSVIRQDTIGNRELVKSAPPITPDTQNFDVLDLFQRNPYMELIPVIQQGEPVGLINRHAFMERLARPFHHDLYGRKPCSLLMEKNPHVVGLEIAVQELSQEILAVSSRAMASGYIVVDKGHYIGVGTVQELLRVLTEMQLQGARHANPLTLLPGNVPITDTANRWIEERISFIACYCDLDHFKPYNDVYGFKKGDAVIEATASVLSGVVDPELDFVGHIGGDDFIILFRSEDWEERCHLALTEFARVAKTFFDGKHIERGGYHSEDRQGKKVFHPLTSLSIGVVEIEPGVISSFMEISRHAAEAKKMAKKTPGNSLFINRRRPAPTEVGDDRDRAIAKKKEKKKEASREHTREALLKKLKECNFRDNLTGLPNRRLFKDRLKQAMRQVRNTPEIIAVVIIDHDDGALTQLPERSDGCEQRLIGKIARRLRLIKRKTDTLARWSEHEFAVLYRGLTSHDHVALMVEKLHETLSQPFPFSGREITISANIGVAIFPHDGEKSDRLVKNATVALRKARESGQGGWQFFETAIGLEMAMRLERIDRLRQAVDRREFVLHYQPKWNPRARRMTGFEALVRWRSDNGELIPPEEFIPLAEESGLILPLGRWIIQSACLQARLWLDAGMKDFTIAINLSPRQMLDPDLGDSVVQALGANEIPPTLLEFEITESVVMKNIHLAIPILEGFAAQGIAVALDDFGTGFSSLSRLQRLPIQTLKIDRSFVRDIHLDGKSEGIVLAIIALGRHHGLQIVAEGVENEAQFTLLTKAGCDELQGFFIHKPLDPEIAPEAFAESTNRLLARTEVPTGETPA
ncbi:MAG: EAL domain-containing protein, partial [Magnetococcales bacterium]|nr:EAL domain-containing protein [Magnetococcales bacterium]